MVDAARTRNIAVSTALLAAFVILAAAPWSLWLPTRVDLGAALHAPSWQHPLGADSLGRDLLARVGLALRDAVLPLWAGVAAGTLAGLAAGLGTLLAAETRLGRPLALGVGAVCAGIGSIPVGIVAFAWAAVWEEAGLMPVLTALSALFGVRTFLQVSDLYRLDRRLAYWTAHEALGGHLLERLWRYGVRGSWRAPLLESLGFHLRAAVAVEASLSYLGFGVQEPRASLGNMLAAHFDLYLHGHWQALAVVVAALALVGAVPGRAFALLLAWMRRSNVQ